MNYPFESHTLYIDLEHQNLDNTKLVYDIDPTSYIEPAGGLAGWNTGNITSNVLTHSYCSQSFSRPQFTVTLSRPLLSGVIKSVLPISIITGISLLAFALAAEDYSQKLALGITTLLSATAFHLSLTNGIPSTGLTLADRNDDRSLPSIPLQHRLSSLPDEVSAQRQKRTSHPIQQKIPNTFAHSNHCSHTNGNIVVKNKQPKIPTSLSLYITMFVTDYAT